MVGVDPSSTGLVSSINRPGGNVTGVSFYDVPVTGKRLALLREMVTKAETIAVLQDPNSRWFEAETDQIGQRLAPLDESLYCQSSQRTRNRCGLFDRRKVRCRRTACRRWPYFFNDRRGRIGRSCSAPRNPGELCYLRVPFQPAGWSAVGRARQTPIVGAGIYVARILKGEKPGDLRWSCRQSSSLQSISGPRERLVSRCRDTIGAGR